jgi:hypothetical protein
VGRQPDALPSRYYRFPAGVTVRFRTGRREVRAHFDAEYGRLGLDSSDTCDVEVRTDGYRRLLRSLRADGVQVSEHRGRHKTVTWRVAIWGLDDETTRLAFEGRGEMAISFLQTFYLEPLLRLKILQKGYALVHGCAVMRGERVILLPGGTGVGKTTLALMQAAKGKGVLGDNYVVLSPRGEAFAVPRRMRVYSDLARTNPEIYRCLPRRHRMRLTVAGLVKRLSMGFANLPSRLAIQDLASDPAVAATGGSLESIYVLVPKAGGELTGPKPLPLEEVVQKVQELNIAEGERLAQVIAPYLVGHPDSRFNVVDVIERDVLRRAFDGLPAYELQVPRVDSPASMANQIARIVGVE